MNNNRILVEFTDGEGYAPRISYRILRSGTGFNGLLFLEKLGEDLMGSPAWKQVPFMDVPSLEVFHYYKRWRDLWYKVAAEVRGQGTFLDTRSVAELPGGYRGIIHVYRLLGDHGIHRDKQEAYIMDERRGPTFVNYIDTFELITSEKKFDLFLGALYVMLREEQDPPKKVA